MYKSSKLCHYKNRVLSHQHTSCLETFVKILILESRGIPGYRLWFFYNSHQCATTLVKSTTLAQEAFYRAETEHERFDLIIVGLCSDMTDRKSTLHALRIAGKISAETTPIAFLLEEDEVARSDYALDVRHFRYGDLSKILTWARGLNTTP